MKNLEVIQKLFFHSRPKINMRQNKLKQIWESGGTILCGWLHIPNTWSAEVMANSGWDGVTVDMQHGLMNIETAMQMMQVISSTTAMPLARVNWNEPGSIMKLLDSGAYGIICPMINTGAECEAFVGACRYPPLGYRSFGPTRGRIYGGPDYGDHANETIVTIAMIETKEAVENIDAILSVKSLDAIFIGSGDLKLSLTGKTGHGNNPKVFEEAVNTILESCQKHQIIPGIWCANATAAKKMIDKGFRFIAVSSDSLMLANYAKEIVKELR